MITANNLTLTFNQQVIFNDVSFNVNKDQKIGLVGRNGSGKSTLLKTLSGEQVIDSGQVTVESGAKIAYFPQEIVLTSELSILDETLGAFGNLSTFNKEFIDLTLYFENENNPSTAMIDRFAFLQKELSDNSFDQAVADTRKMLTWLGFDPGKFDRPVSELSVGWKMRIVLAKLLLQRADFYLFDEPTNHLDIVAKDWFLDFLKNSKFGFILISHDRFFLDTSCKQIFELERGKFKIYRGNYSEYLKQKEHDSAILQVKYEAQQKYIRETTDLINRFRAKASKASMAQSLLKTLEKIELIEIPPRVPDIKLSFPNVKRSGDVVLKVENVSKSFDSNVLFKHVSFSIERGDKVSLVAANGKGKTTLLNLITGKYQLESGTINLGYNVELAFFEQDQELALNKEKTVLEEAEDVCTTSEMRQRVRGLLGAFLFSGDEVDKKIKVLSGGEKNRIAMVKILLQNANFLVLDEPTNHLDIQTKEILLKALCQYPGTILFVSHDRAFIDGLATNVLDLSCNGIIDYPGNYESYCYHKEHNLQNAKNDKPIANDKDMDLAISSISESKEWYALRKNIASIERKIETQEKKLAILGKNFEVSTYGSSEYEDLLYQINQIKKKLEGFYKVWEELQEKVNSSL